MTVAVAPGGAARVLKPERIGRILPTYVLTDARQMWDNDYTALFHRVGYAVKDGRLVML